MFAPRIICLPLLLILGASACAEQGAPIRQDVLPPVPAPTPKVPPWLVLELGFQDVGTLATWLGNVSGFARLVIAAADPPWAAPEALEAVGPLNPETRMLDVDGDGTLDPTWDLDVFSMALGGGGGPAAIWGGEGNAPTTARVGVVLYTFVGEPVESFWLDQPVRLEPSDRPLEARLDSVATPTAPLPCYDGIDNDEDGWTDDLDSDCRGGGPLLERGPGHSTCSDGLDNDGDGAIDSDDAGCISGADLSERSSCEDGLDEDGDTWVDGDDPDCQQGLDEHGFGLAPCNDGLDNDLDSFVDALDPDCHGAGDSEGP